MFDVKFERWKEKLFLYPVKINWFYETKRFNERQQKNFKDSIRRFNEVTNYLDFLGDSLFHNVNVENSFLCVAHRVVVMNVFISTWNEKVMKIILWWLCNRNSWSVEHLHQMNFLLQITYGGRVVCGGEDDVLGFLRYFLMWRIEYEIKKFRVLSFNRANTYYTPASNNSFSQLIYSTYSRKAP